MTRCNREELVLAHVRSGRPDAELDAHIEHCDDCASIAAVANAIVIDHRDALRSAPVPPSGLVWWRMQRRAAEESARAASRAVIAAQTLSFAAAIVVVIALLTTFGGTSLRALKSFMHMPSAATFAQWELPIGVMIVMLIAFTPVALYLAIARD